jgi:hypothetical protein
MQKADICSSAGTIADSDSQLILILQPAYSQAYCCAFVLISIAIFS